MPAIRPEALRFRDGVLIHDPFGDERVSLECCQGESCYTGDAGGGGSTANSVLAQGRHSRRPLYPKE